MGNTEDRPILTITRTDRSAPGTVFDCALTNQNAIGRAVALLTQCGVAIMFGLTSDGGCMCLTTFDGDERGKVYVKDPERLAMALDLLIEHHTKTKNMIPALVRSGGKRTAP